MNIFKKIKTIFYKDKSPWEYSDKQLKKAFEKHRKQRGLENARINEAG